MKIGIIGCGNMGHALVHCLVQNKEIMNDNIHVYVRSEQKANCIKEEFGLVCVSMEKIHQCDMILIATKSIQYESVCKALVEHTIKEQIIISITTPQTLKDLETYFGRAQKIIRMMPNTPVAISQGVCAFIPNEYCEEQDINAFYEMFKNVGILERIEEHQMPAFIGLAGSSPAYFYHILEVMGDAGVNLGLSREQSIRIAAQTMQGSASLLIETKVHPTLLKEAVCSPKGATIEALRTFEQRGFSSALWEGILACANKK